MRRFEKISYDMFKKLVSDDKNLYDSIMLPKRSTKSSAGYDIRSIEQGVIPPHQSKIFKTGLKVCMNSDEVLYIYSRSSFGYKYDVCLTNNGNSDFKVNINDRIAQGVFMKYLTVDDEEEINSVRTGGFGSTERR